MQVDPNDPKSVIWLQQALTKLLPAGLVIIQMAVFDSLTQKALRNYQTTRGLPVTGNADEATVQAIEIELENKGLTIS